MKRTLTSLLALALATSAGAQTATKKTRPAAKPAAAAKSGEAIEKIPTNPQIQAIEKRRKPLPPFTPQEPKRIQLANGMVIFLQEDHELPFVEGTARVRGGTKLLPPEKAGETSIYSQVWRTGGTTAKTGDQLDDFLEARAASVETSGGTDSSSVTFNCLKQDLPEVFDVFMDLLQNPQFRQEKVELAKQQIKTAISRRNEDPSDIARREANRLLYGKDSPYTRQAEYWTVDAITREDLIAFHHQTVHPNNIILGVVGDFDSAQMEARIRQAFESLPKGPALPETSETFSEPKPGIYFAEKDDVNQSNIRMVALGVKKDSPDYYAITVMNEALGGGFAARLFSSIRTRQGLAYSVGGGVGSDFDHPGAFVLAMGTKSETTARSIEALRNEIANLKTHPFTPAEVEIAKANILNSFVFNFDSKDKVLGEKMTYEFYGYPLDRLEKFRAGVEKVTLADVQNVVEKYVLPKQFAAVVVGKAEDFDRKLDELGPVTKLDISIPTEKPGAPSASAKLETNPEGKAMIAKVVAALGGKERLAAVKSVHYTTDSMRTMGPNQVPVKTDDLIRYPDQIKSTLSTPQGDVVIDIAADEATMSMGGQSGPMPPPMKDEALRGLRRDAIWVAQHADDPKFIFHGSGTEDGLAVLDIDADGAVTRWFIDPQGLIVRTSAKAQTMQGPVQRVSDLSDYKDVEGVKLPFKRVVKENDKVTQETTVKEAKINP